MRSFGVTQINTNHGTPQTPVFFVEGLLFINAHFVLWSRSQQFALCVVLHFGSTSGASSGQNVLEQGSHRTTEPWN